VQPKGIIKVELCSASGQLATDKCFETVENKETGEKVERRTTFFEIATEDQAPKVGCEVHNGGASQSFVKVIPGAEWPRAALAVDVAAVQVVVMKAPTVLGFDPYNSIQSVNNAMAMSSLNGQTAPLNSSAIVTAAPAPGDGQQPIEVRRAEPVQPKMQEQAVLDTTIKVPPVPPLDF